MSEQEYIAEREKSDGFSEGAGKGKTSREGKWMMRWKKEQEPRGSKDATTLSSLIVHFLVFSSSIDGQTDGPSF